MNIFPSISWLWGQFSYVAALIVGTALVSLRMPKRKQYGFRVLVSCLFILLLKMAADLLLVNGRSYSMVVPVNLSLSVMLYLLTAIAVVFCHDCDIYAGLFCSTIGYSLQHISHRLYMVLSYAGLITELWQRILALSIVTCLVYLLAYRLLVSDNRFRNILVDNRRQLVISSLFIMTVIFLDQFILNAAQEFVTKIQIVAMSCVTCVLGIMLEISEMSSKNYELERDIAARLRKEENEKLAYDKAVIEMLNIKAHDLKHQVENMNTASSQEVKEEVEKVVSSYENTIHSGNIALDAILARKMRLAVEKDIRITCMADGERLSFLSDIDIYSLFGNILDNSLEAAEKLEDKEKRIISITVESKGYFVSINARNYFAGEVHVEDGKIQTTKEDRMSHGFGIASIRKLVEKYNGSMTIHTKEDMFILDILFPT